MKAFSLICLACPYYQPGAVCISFHKPSLHTPRNAGDILYHKRWGDAAEWERALQIRPGYEQARENLQRLQRMGQ